MDKISQKITKDPKRQERGKKSRETYMKRLKEQILEEFNQPSTPTPTDSPMPPTSSSTGNLTPSTSSSTGDPTPSHTTRSNDTYVMALVCLLALPSVFVYFLHITLLRLKIKNSSMKNRINHQKDVICFRKIYNKWLVLIRRKTLKTSSEAG